MFNATVITELLISSLFKVLIAVCLFEYEPMLAYAFAMYIIEKVYFSINKLMTMRAALKSLKVNAENLGGGVVKLNKEDKNEKK